MDSSTATERIKSVASSRVRKDTRICKHPGCGKKFEGSPSSLYCAEHRSRKSRTERFIPKELPKPEDHNLILESTGSQPVRKTLLCSLTACDREYSFTVYPDHKVYPMYCELHRTEHKRRHFLQMLSSGTKPRYQALGYEKWRDYEMQFEEYALNLPSSNPFSDKTPRDKKLPA